MDSEDFDDSEFLGKDFTIVKDPSDSYSDSRIKRRKSSDIVLDNVVDSGIYFGTDLYVLVAEEESPISNVPYVLYVLCNELLKNVTAEGLFSIPGDLHTIKRFSDDINIYGIAPLFYDISLQETGEPNQFIETTPHVIAGVIKKFFRELKEPLIPSTHINAILKASDSATLHNLVKELPSPNRETLQYFTMCLTKVSKKAARNKMNPKALSNALSSVLFKFKDMKIGTKIPTLPLELMIREYSTVFEGMELQPNEQFFISYCKFSSPSAFLRVIQSRKQSSGSIFDIFEWVVREIFNSSVLDMMMLSSPQSLEEFPKTMIDFERDRRIRENEGEMYRSGQDSDLTFSPSKKPVKAPIVKKVRFELFVEYFDDDNETKERKRKETEKSTLKQKEFKEYYKEKQRLEKDFKKRQAEEAKREKHSIDLIRKRQRKQELALRKKEKELKERQSRKNKVHVKFQRVVQYLGEDFDASRGDREEEMEVDYNEEDSNLSFGFIRPKALLPKEKAEASEECLDIDFVVPDGQNYETVEEFKLLLRYLRDFKKSVLSRKKILYVKDFLDIEVKDAENLRVGDTPPPQTMSWLVEEFENLYFSIRVLISQMVIKAHEYSSTVELIEDFEREDAITELTEKVEKMRDTIAKIRERLESVSKSVIGSYLKTLLYKKRYKERVSASEAQVVEEEKQENVKGESEN